MDNYLIQFFEDSNTLILPGFGALTMINRANHELMFMPFMKHNDTSLASLIADKENVSVDVAQSKVHEYVETLLKRLNDGQKVIIPSIGKFSMNSAGEIEYESYTKENLNQNEESSKEDVVIPSIEDTVIPTIVHEPTIEPKIEQEEPFSTPLESVSKERIEHVHLPIEEEQEDSSSLVDSNANKEQFQQEEIIVAEEPEVVPVIPITPIEEKDPMAIITPKEEPKKLSEEEQWNDDLDLPPVGYQTPKPKQPIVQKIEKDKKPKRGVVTFIILILAAAIAGGGIYAGSNWKELNCKLFGKCETPKIDENPVENKENVGDDNNEGKSSDDNKSGDNTDLKDNNGTGETEEKSANNENSDGQKNPSSDNQGNLSTNGIDKNKKVQLMVGSFASKANADKLIAKLEKVGVKAAIIYYSNGLHAVSAGSFNSVDELKQNQALLDKVGTYWIKK